MRKWAWFWCLYEWSKVGVFITFHPRLPNTVDPMHLALGFRRNYKSNEFASYSHRAFHVLNVDTIVVQILLSWIYVAEYVKNSFSEKSFFLEKVCKILFSIHAKFSDIWNRNIKATTINKHNNRCNSFHVIAVHLPTLKIQNAHYMQTVGQKIYKKRHRWVSRRCDFGSFQTIS